jgi:aerobactin synthase
LLAELCYEQLLSPEPLVPEPIGRGELRDYQVVTDAATYSFAARRGTFGSWWPEPDSLRRAEGGKTSSADDPVRFVVDARAVLAWPDDVVADVVRDLRATQLADARLAGDALPAAELADLGYRDLEGYQTGHPCVVANKGRLGFSLADAARYSPEARAPFRLLWVAAHPDLGRYHAAAVTPTQLLSRELDETVRSRFAATLTAALTAAFAEAPTGPLTRAVASEYVWLPVHPWQWENVISLLYADELARGLLVLLGEAPDRYVPLQAIRTVTNIDRPDRLDVKLSLMIRNTLVWRGLSAADAEAGPAASAWVISLRDADAFLATTTRVLPQPEVAGAIVRHRSFEALTGAPYRFHELSGVLWREPVGALIAPGESARTFASLLLVGSDGRALVTELVTRSGRAPQVWLRALLRALLHPVLHYLYAYGMAFTPHGENVAVVFDASGLPTRIAVKDFGADLLLVEGDFPERGPVPGAAAKHLRRWPSRLLAHSVLSAIFAGHFRYFSVLVADHLGIDEDEFWGLVRDAVEDYQRQFPRFAGRFADMDLFAPTFGRVCLNREQLAGAGFHDRTDRDAGFDVIHGEVANPLHRPAGAR